MIRNAGYIRWRARSREHVSAYRHKAVIYRVNGSNCTRRFEKWADQLVNLRNRRRKQQIKKGLRQQGKQKKKNPSAP